jgi:hypothetical protein
MVMIEKADHQMCVIRKGTLRFTTVGRPQSPRESTSTHLKTFSYCDRSGRKSTITRRVLLFSMDESPSSAPATRDWKEVRRLVGEFAEGVVFVVLDGREASRRGEAGHEFRTFEVFFIKRFEVNLPEAAVAVIYTLYMAENEEGMEKTNSMTIKRNSLRSNVVLPDRDINIVVPITLTWQTTTALSENRRMSPR